MPVCITLGLLHSCTRGTRSVLSIHGVYTVDMTAYPLLCVSYHSLQVDPLY